MTAVRGDDDRVFVLIPATSQPNTAARPPQARALMDDARLGVYHTVSKKHK